LRGIFGNMVLPEFRTNYLIYVYYMYIPVKKHGIRFSDAETLLFDPDALTREDIESEGEQRFVTVGMDAGSHILVAVYAYRSEDIRLISARSATNRERRQHEEGI
jgi:uncharacterized DUF497 family protein